MRRNLDGIDAKILAELRKDARISHTDIAERVHLSRNAVRLRVERLEQDGIISGYTIIEAKPERSGSRLAAVIFVQRRDRMRGGDVIASIQAKPEVLSCEVMTGDFDLLVRVESEDADRIRKVWHDISELPGVADTTTVFVLKTVFDRK